MFERAHWAGDDGLAEIDLTRMTGLGINFWADDEANEGIVWVDDIGLAIGDLESTAPSAEPEEIEVEDEADESASEPEEVAEQVEPTVPSEATEPEPADMQESTETTDPPTPVAEESGGGACPLSTIAVALVVTVAVVVSKNPPVKRS
jgi:hypothetical protein